MPSKRQQLAGRRGQVGDSATPVNVSTQHLTPVAPGELAEGGEDLVAFWVPLTDLDPSPFQYRYALDPVAVAALARSIEVQELYQPITVRPAGAAGRYQVVLGHRRLEAFRQLGRPAIPALIREYDDVQVVRAMLDENLRREDVNLFEQTEGVVRLVALTSGRSGEPAEVTRKLLGEMRTQHKAGHTDAEFTEPHRSAAQLIQDVTGMSWFSFYANRMRVYSLPQALQAAVRSGMPYSLALAVQRLPQARQGEALAFLGAPDGPWRSRQELAAWAQEEHSPPSWYLQRLHRLQQALGRRPLNTAEQARLEQLLQDIEHLLA